MLKLNFEAEKDQLTTSPSKKRRQTLLMHIELNEATSNKKHKTLIANSPESLNSGGNEEEKKHEDCCNFSPRLSSSSCCSSNGSSSKNIKRITSIDLADLQDEVETSVYSSCRERDITTPSSQETEEVTSTESMEENSRRKSSSVSSTGRRRVMPSESELEDFFAQAEKNIQKQFTDKYNYDITKDEPLKGRYEWVRLKP